MRDYYAKIFTGEPLDIILSTYFLEIDGKVYALYLDGVSGAIITNIEIKLIAENGGKYIYETAYQYVWWDDEGELIYDGDLARFAIEKVENEYRISNMDFISFHGR